MNELEMVLAPQLEEKLENIGVMVKKIIEKGNDMSVKSDEDMQFATKFLGDLKPEIKRIETDRKEWVDPLNAQVKKINGLFKSRLEPMQAVEKLIKSKMVVYVDAQEKIAQDKRDTEEKTRLLAETKAKAVADEARKIEEDAIKKATEATNKAEKELAEKEVVGAKAKVEELAQAEEDIKNTPVEVEQAKTQTRSESGAVSSVKKTWEVEIVDPSKVESKFMIPDEKAIKQAVKDGMREGPGLRIYQKNSIATRS